MIPNPKDRWRVVHLQRAGVPRARVHWRWETAPPTVQVVLPAVREAFQTGRSCVFSGPPGTGKTGLCTGAVIEAYDQGIRTGYITLPLLLVELNDCYKDGGEPRGKVLKGWFGPDSPDFLAIDDLGAELRETDAVKADVWLMIEMRLAHGKQTWITTNCTLEELQRRYDKRTWSRLQDYQHFEVVGKDQRGIE